MKKEIKEQIYKAIEKLGGKSDILAIIGSIDDTMTDEEIIVELETWNNLSEGVDEDLINDRIKEDPDIQTNK